MESNVPQLAKVPKHTRVSINRIPYALHVVEQNVTRNQLMGQLFLLNFLKICRTRVKEIVTTKTLNVSFRSPFIVAVLKNKIEEYKSAVKICKGNGGL